jgi:hypothetical protein
MVGHFYFLVYFLKIVNFVFVYEKMQVGVLGFA